jgi:hypothetical protein
MYMKVSWFSCALLYPALALAQYQYSPSAMPNEPSLSAADKLDFHFVKVFSPLSLLEDTGESVLDQYNNFPKEWGQGWHGLWRRTASNVGYDTMRNTFLFTADSIAGQDPRYFRSGEGAFLSRTSHALGQTFVGHTDSKKAVLPWVRLAATFGAAFMTNAWYPGRLAHARDALVRGASTLGSDAGNNFIYEFWPDVKKKLFHRKTQAADPGPVMPAS